MVAGTNDRKIIQANGRSLPFRNQHFDYILALWSTYQIPEEFKEEVFRELMRVGNILHLGPIFKIDYDIIKEVANKEGFEILSCHPFGKYRQPLIKTEDDYYQLMREPENKRIAVPSSKDATLIQFLGVLTVSSKGGSTIILRRKEN